jgi:hypothetical protein
MTHEMTVLTPSNLVVKDGITLRQLLAAMTPFLRHHLRADAVEELEGFDDADQVAEVDNHCISLDDRRFYFYVDCCGPGHGEDPYGPFTDMIDALRPHLAQGGIIEIVDHDLSSVNDEARVLRYVPATDEACTEADAARECAIARCVKALEAIAPTDVEKALVAISQRMNGAQALRT